MCMLCGFADVFHLIHFYLVDRALDNCSCEQLAHQLARLPVSPRHLVVLALLSVWADPRLLTFLFLTPTFHILDQISSPFHYVCLLATIIRAVNHLGNPAVLGSTLLLNSPQPLPIVPYLLNLSLVPLFPGYFELLRVFFYSGDKNRWYWNTCLTNSVWTFCLCFGDEAVALIWLCNGICTSQIFPNAVARVRFKVKNSTSSRSPTMKSFRGTQTKNLLFRPVFLCLQIFRMSVRVACFAPEVKVGVSVHLRSPFL